MLPLGRVRARFSDDKVRQFVEGRETAFQSEYLCHRVVSGIRGFPRLLCRGSYANGPVMLMEWVEGVSLYDMRNLWTSRARSGFPMGTCASLGASIASSLMLARKRDAAFVHRDISSKNVILRTRNSSVSSQLSTSKFDICLIDFGSSVCSCVQEGEDEGKPRVWRSATPEYAPPEMLTHEIPQLREARLLESVDVYEVCSLLYELYCGRLPYELPARDVSEIFQLKANYLPKRLVPQEPSDEKFCETVMAGLRPKPFERLSLEELSQELERRR